MSPRRARVKVGKASPKARSEALAVEWVPIESVQRYARNPRKNARAVEKVRASIERFGWRQPIVVDAERVIIAGDTRYLAAQAMGLERVPVHVATGLTPAEVRAYRLADNRTAEEAEWDSARLVEELEAVEAEDSTLLASLGFDDAELGGYLGDATTGEDALEEVEVLAQPTMAWVLIGIPVPRYDEIAGAVEDIALLPGVFCEVTARDDDVPAQA